MSDTKVKEEEILSALRSLEPERWFEVLDFIGYLKHRTTELPKTSRVHSLTARELLSSELVGIWADRDDIGDTLTFARYLRQQAERRQRDNDVAT
jgi:hypothetical protein